MQMWNVYGIRLYSSYTVLSQTRSLDVHDTLLTLGTETGLGRAVIVRKLFHNM